MNDPVLLPVCLLAVAFASTVALAPVAVRFDGPGLTLMFSL